MARSGSHRLPRRRSWRDYLPRWDRGEWLAFAAGVMCVVGVATALVLSAEHDPTRPVSGAPTVPGTSAPVSTGSPASTPPPVPGDVVSGSATTPYKVSVTIKPGTYRTDGAINAGTRCYWQRLRDSESTGQSEVMQDHYASGPDTVTIKASDTAFTTLGCKPWRRVQ